MKIYLITDGIDTVLSGYRSQANRDGAFLISNRAYVIGTNFMSDYGKWPTDTEILDIARDEDILQEIVIND